jgi:HSP20 family protein
MLLTRHVTGPSRNLDPFAIFDEFFAPARLRGTPAALPLDLWEQNETLHAELELPGVREDELELSVFDKQLRIRVQRSQPAQLESEQSEPNEQSENQAEASRPERRYFARERALRSSEFERVLRLPYDVDADRVEAELADGILQIRLPKAASLQPRRISLRRPQQA